MTIPPAYSSENCPDCGEQATGDAQPGAPLEPADELGDRRYAAALRLTSDPDVRVTLVAGAAVRAAVLDPGLCGRLGLAGDVLLDDELAARVVSAETARRRGGEAIPAQGSEGPDELAPSALIAEQRFVRASEFAARAATDEPIRPLLGTHDDALIVAGGLHIIAGPDGGTKSTLALDLVAYLAAGLGWLGIPVAAPVPIVYVENEGPRAGARLRIDDKLRSWDGPPWDERVLVYESPWGEFDLTDGACRTALMRAVAEHEAELVVAGPLLGIGASGEGRPGDTTALVSLLRRECGLGRGLAWLFLHHLNVQNEVSGDWKRHCDTVFRVERDGVKGRTKLSFPKPPRWGAPRHPMILGWVEDCRSFEVIDAEAATDRKLEGERRAARWLADYVHEHPGLARGAVEEAYVQEGGARAHIRAAISAAITAQEAYKQALRQAAESSGTTSQEAQAELERRRVEIRLDVRPGESPSGKYLYPAWEADSPLAEGGNGEYGERLFEPCQEPLLADSPSARREGGETAASRAAGPAEEEIERLANRVREVQSGEESSM